MGGRCQVCDSVHRAEYDEMLTKRVPVTEVRRYAQRKYNENFSYHGLRRHKINHVVKLIQAQVEADKFRKKIIDREIEKDIELLGELRESLDTLKNQANAIKDQMTDPKARAEARKIIEKANETIVVLLRFSDKLGIKPKQSEEEIFNRVLYCIKDFPTEYIMEFKKRWDEFGSREKTL